ncbi:MAG: RDD family protein [Chryseobacterium sp.]|nr:RDD family protein [Candidatus Chryseobacterium enterohippi]
MIKHLKIIEDSKASKLIRFANFVIDRIVFTAFLYLLGIFAGLLQVLFDFNFLVDIITDASELGRTADILLSSTIYLILLLVLEYFTKGRTISKYITGTKVIMIDGTQPSFSTYMLRTICRIVPFDGLSFLGENGWHDSWSNTRVIDIKAYSTKLAMETDLESLGKK